MDITPPGTTGTVASAPVTGNTTTAHFGEPSFVALLACPACDSRPPLRFEEADTAGDCRFVCVRCGRIYPILDGIPDLTADEWEEPPFAA